MAVGLRVRDPNTGIIIVEITDRLTRWLGTLYTGGSPGAIGVGQFSMGTGWAIVQEPPPPNLNIANTYRPARATISGTTLSWDFPGPASLQVIPCNILYGVY